MLILTFQVNCAAWHIPGIKEALATLLGLSAALTAQVMRLGNGPAPAAEANTGRLWGPSGARNKTVSRRCLRQ